MKISNFLNTSNVSFKLSVTSKDDLLEKMLSLAEKSGKIIDRNEVKSEILKRESIMSTGIGKGIALPHAKSNAIKDTTGSFAVLENPINYDAIDGGVVNIVFLLIGLENNIGEHLRLLSKISKYLDDNDFRNRIMSCETNEGIIAAFNQIDIDE